MWDWRQNVKKMNHFFSLSLFHLNLIALAQPIFAAFVIVIAILEIICLFMIVVLRVKQVTSVVKHKICLCWMRDDGNSCKCTKFVPATIVSNRHFTLFRHFTRTYSVYVQMLSMAAMTLHSENKLLSKSQAHNSMKWVHKENGWKWRENTTEFLMTKKPNNSIRLNWILVFLMERTYNSPKSWFYRGRLQTYNLFFFVLFLISRKERQMESDSNPVSHIERKIEKWILKYDADQWTEMDFFLALRISNGKRSRTRHQLKFSMFSIQSMVPFIRNYVIFSRAV